MSLLFNIFVLLFYLQEKLIIIRFLCIRTHTFDKNQFSTFKLVISSYMPIYINLSGDEANKFSIHARCI